MLKVIPFGDRVMVKRRKIGEKVGSILLPDETKERPTDLADVTYVPDLTFSDQKILDNAESIIEGLTKKSIEGDADAVVMLLKMNEFVRQKSIRVGDAVMISKYVGTDFIEKGGMDTLTLVRLEDIIGLVVDNG